MSTEILRIIFWSLIAAVIIVAASLTIYMGERRRRILAKWDPRDFEERIEKIRQTYGEEHAQRMADYEMRVLKQIKEGRGGRLPLPPKLPEPLEKQDGDKGQ